MPLTLHYRPFASFCQKVLIALYEADVPFTPHLVDLGDAGARTQFHDLWPSARCRVLRDAACDRIDPLGRHPTWRTIWP